VREWLVRQTPDQVDKALRTSLISSLGVEATLRVETRFPPEGGFYTVVAGCHFDGMTPDKREAAVAKVRAAMTPPTLEQAENWLVALQAACAPNRRSEANTAVALELYAGALCRYPADVAKQACMELALRHPRAGETNWFPTLGELDAACQLRAAPRRAMLQALETWSPKPKREELSPEQRKAMAAELIRAVARGEKAERPA
jgi:hypothetical protein